MNPWIEVEEPLNKTMVWKGAIANPEYWQEYPELAVDFDPPWYHCRKCLDDGVSSFKTRLSVGTKFCPNCGTELEWPNLTIKAQS